MRWEPSSSCTVVSRAARRLRTTCGSGSVKDLTSQKLAQLGIALAFVGEPDAVVVDDVESQLTMSQSEALVDLLLDAARTRNVAVVVGVVERDLAAMADATVYLSKDGE